MENITQPPIFDSEEISLRELILPLWERRKFIAKISLVFGLVGLVWAFIRPPEYTASITFIPQTTEKASSLGNLGGLAAMAGINLQGLGSGSEIPPSIYPKIISSSVFRRELLAAELTTENGKKISYSGYFDNVAPLDITGKVLQYTIGLPGQIRRLMVKEKVEVNDSRLPEDIIQVTKEEDEHFKRLEKQLKVTVDKKENSVQITFVMPDAKMAAQMTQFSYELLQRELIQYKIELAKEQLKFIEGQFEQKKIIFQLAQANLGSFRDQNQNLSSARATNREEALEAEFNLAFSVYSEMAKQLEQAKIQVSKDTPIFSVIQPVQVPLIKSSISKFSLLLLAFISGLVIATFWIFIKRFNSERSAQR